MDAGRLQAMFTCPVKPPTEVKVACVVPDCPGAEIVMLAIGPIVNGAGAPIVSATVVVAVKAPEVPVIVTVVGPPAVAELLAVSVSTLELAELVGLNDAVTPLGRPLAAKLTLPVNPPTSVTVMVLVPTAPPGAIVTLPGAAARVKLAVALTTMGTELLCPAVTA
jgi:hypothetical protein